VRRSGTASPLSLQAAIALALGACCLGAACTAVDRGLDTAPQRALTACRSPIAADGTAATPAIRWQMPGQLRDLGVLNAWCGTTGPPVVVPNAVLPAAVSPTSAGDAELVVVSWNLHVGSADLAALVSQLRAGAYTGGVQVTRFVLLLQEAYRGGAVVPLRLPRGMRAPTAVGTRAGNHERMDVVRLAESLGLALFYVPSMRNGPPGRTTEDRGNAILSTETLSDFTAIELPFERQRRVAIAATVWSRSAGRKPWALRVASVHLASTGSARRLWVLAQGARARQARGLLEALRPHESLVVAGDFNTWRGFSDSTYKILAAALPDSAAGDRRHTFLRLFRLDHVFAKPPQGWTVTARRLDDKLGSDHFPLLARVQPRRAGTEAEPR
jgi:endonuclease/exonuclease/phosphatase family metal-dependent hydrolase